MVDVLDSMIEGAANAFRRPDREGIARSRRLDDVLDALNGEIKHYVMQLDPEGLPTKSTGASKVSSLSR